MHLLRAALKRLLPCLGPPTTPCAPISPTSLSSPVPLPGCAVESEAGAIIESRIKQYINSPEIDEFIWAALEKKVDQMIEEKIRPMLDESVLEKVAAVVKEKVLPLLKQAEAHADAAKASADSALGKRTRSAAS